MAEYRTLNKHPDFRVGTDGTFWRCLRGEWKRIIPVQRKNGYMYVAIPGVGRSKDIPLHRLVLTTFAGPCPKGMQACHGDGNKTNNQLSNLRWDTNRQNQMDKIAHGTYGASLTINKVCVIRERFKLFLTHLSEECRASPACVRDVIIGKTWKIKTQGLASSKRVREAIRSAEKEAIRLVLNS